MENNIENNLDNQTLHDDYPETESKGLNRFNTPLFWVLSMMAIFCLAFFGSYLVLNLTDDEQIAQAPVVAVPETIVQAPTIGTHTIISRETTYTTCGHCLKEIVTGNAAYVGKTYDTLSNEGWIVSDTGPAQVRLAKEVTGLCPDDEERRVIKTTANGIGVYQGTKVSMGNLLMELPVSTDALPTEIQNQLTDGGIELANENELLEVLESIDELVMENDI